MTRPTQASNGEGRETVPLEAHWHERIEAMVTRDGRKMLQAPSSTTRIMRSEFTRRYPMPSRKNVVEYLAVQTPRQMMEAEDHRVEATSNVILARSTLFPVYASAVAAAVTASSLDRPADDRYKWLFHALMNQMEAYSPNEGAGVLRMTALTRGPWSISYRSYLNTLELYGANLARDALLVSGLGFPPNTRILNLGELYFPLERERTLTARDTGKALGAPTQYAAFPDTLLVPLAAFAGGPQTGPAAFRQLVVNNEAWLNAILKEAGVDGPVQRDYGMPMPGRAHLLHANLDGFLHHESWSAREIEVQLRLAANNLVEAIRLTFQTARLPDYHAARTMLGKHGRPIWETSP